MLIHIRGPAGSGKSTLVRKFVDGAKPIYGLLGPRKPEAYLVRPIYAVKKPLHVLGPYHTAAGGADQFIPFALLEEAVRRYKDRGHILLESYITHGKTSDMENMCRAMGKQCIIAFMDTPIETCIENVKKRRAEKGITKEYSPKHLLLKAHNVDVLRDWATAAGKVRIEGISMFGGYNSILGWLREAE